MSKARKVYSLRLSDLEKAKYQVLADRAGISLGEWIRLALDRMTYYDPAFPRVCDCGPSEVCVLCTNVDLETE